MSALKLFTTSAALAVLVFSAAPARSADDCDNVMRDMGDAIQIATKNLDQSMAAVKNAPNQTSARNLFCAASGEFLGSSTAFRALVNECFPDGSHREQIATLDKSIKDIQAALDATCK